MNKTISVGQQMWSLSVEEVSTDCIIMVKYKNDTKIFKLHKMILMKSSPVFKSMFETNMSEGISGETEITDIEPRIMELTLKHIYGCKFEKELTVADIKKLFIVADKYFIETLQVSCVKYITKYLIKPENVLFLLNLKSYWIKSSQAEFIEIQLLIKLRKETEDCLNIEEKSEITEEVLLTLLQLDKCNLNTELDLIKFVDTWAIAQMNKQQDLDLKDECKIRKLLDGEILSLLRFLTLTRGEFMDLCVYCNWLTRNEKNEIIQYINTRTISDTFPKYLSNSRICRSEVKLENIRLLRQLYPYKNYPIHLRL